jgi:hypothetical protein
MTANLAAFAQSLALAFMTTFALGLVVLPYARSRGWWS